LGGEAGESLYFVEQRFTTIGVIVNVIAFGLWLILLMFLSTAWKNRLDGPCASLTQWAEEVMMGKKSFWLWIDDVQVEIEEVFGGTQKKTDEVRKLEENPQ
jgi:hypothetical protein